MILIKLKGRMPTDTQTKAKNREISPITKKFDLNLKGKQVKYSKGKKTVENYLLIYGNVDHIDINSY